MNKYTNRDIFLMRRVGKSWERHQNRKDERLKSKFNALIERKGQSNSEIYKKLGIDKADWSRITWGITIPDISTQVLIATELDCDSAVLWGDLTSEEEAILNAKQSEEVVNGNN